MIYGLECGIIKRMKARMLSLPLGLYFRSTSTTFSVWRDTVKQSDYRMNLEFAICVIFALVLMFKRATSQTCDIANWWENLDKREWSVCPKMNTYLRGFLRSNKLLGDERVVRLEKGRCCEADEPSYAIQPTVCSYANWTSTLDG